MTEISRRVFVKQSAAPLAVAAMSRTLFANEPLSKMGIASTSFMGAQIPGSPARPGAATARPMPRDRRDATLWFFWRNATRLAQAVCRPA